MKRLASTILFVGLAALLGLMTFVVLAAHDTSNPNAQAVNVPEVCTSPEAVQGVIEGRVKEMYQAGLCGQSFGLLFWFEGYEPGTFLWHEDGDPMVVARWHDEAGRQWYTWIIESQKYDYWFAQPTGYEV